MARYFTSDLHLGHARIIDFCSRPYADVDHMDHDLLARINTVCSEDDELFILGDIAMGDATRSLALLSRLRPSLVLLAGNHDKFSPYRGSSHVRWLDLASELSGATQVHPTWTRLDLPSRSLLLSHFPFAPDPHDRRSGPDRFAALRPDDDGSWLLCGHVHGGWRQHGRMVNVGVDAWGGLPVSESQLADLFAAGERDLEPLPWSSLT